MDEAKLREMVRHLWSLADGGQWPLPDQCELCGEIRKYYLNGCPLDEEIK